MHFAHIEVPAEGSSIEEQLGNTGLRILEVAGSNLFPAAVDPLAEIYRGAPACVSLYILSVGDIEVSIGALNGLRWIAAVRPLRRKEEVVPIPGEAGRDIGEVRIHPGNDFRGGPVAPIGTGAPGHPDIQIKNDVRRTCLPG
jgi:hypothetical protein